MKKNDWLIIVSTAAYSFLFYKQSPGLNFFLFNVLLVVLLAIQNRSALSQKAWLAAAGGSIVSSFCVFWYGNTLSVLANLTSVLVLGGLTFSAGTSLIIAGINSCFSVMVTIPYAIKGMFEGSDTEKDGESITAKIPIFIIPLVVTVVFFFVYRAANPVFEKFTDNINLDFISFEWVVFTGMGLILMGSIFRHRVLQFLTEVDKSEPDALRPISFETHMARIPMFSVGNETLSGIVLFGMLNLLLFSVNAIDINCLWVTKLMPDGITYADYLHNGTYTLILSICMAIAVILFVFRGYLNFFEGNKWLKVLAYGWIAQNVILIITTAERNWLVIESSGITRKRIGVYVYLLLCLIGLTTTLIKVVQRKSNWFLFRKNAWTFYAVFIAACPINWDNFIVQYNYQHFKTLEFKYIDRRYNTELSHTSLALLFKIYATEKKEALPVPKVVTDQIATAMYANYHELKEQVQASSWKSYCVSKADAVNTIDGMIERGEIEKR